MVVCSEADKRIKTKMRATEDEIAAVTSFLRNDKEEIVSYRG